MAQAAKQNVVPLLFQPASSCDQLRRWAICRNINRARHKVSILASSAILIVTHSADDHVPLIEAELTRLSTPFYRLDTDASDGVEFYDRGPLATSGIEAKP